MTETKSVGHSQVRTRCVTANSVFKGLFCPQAPHLLASNGELQRGRREGGRRLELPEQEAIWPVLTFSEPVPITSLALIPRDNVYNTRDLFSDGLSSANTITLS